MMDKEGTGNKNANIICFNSGSPMYPCDSSAKLLCIL